MTDDGLRFETLDPPSGGLARLRANIRQDTRRRVQLRRVRAAALAVCLAAAIGWALFEPRSAPMAPPAEFEFVRISLGLAPPPTGVLTIPEDRRADTAVQRVPLATDRVVFYRVAFLRD